MLREPGCLYVAYSRYCDWVKIGFTSKGVRERLEAINKQYADFAPFSLIGSVPSTWRAEQQIHRLFMPMRRYRKGLTCELYPATRPLVGTVKNILTYREWKVVEGRTDIRRIVRWAHAAGQSPSTKIEVVLAYERHDAEHRRAA
jgi:hypothetical protein